MGSSLSQQSAEETVSLWRSRPAHDLIFDSGRRVTAYYLQAVDRLQKSPKAKPIDDLIAASMERLRAEFHTVLSRQSAYQAGAPPSTNEWSSVADSTAYVFRYEDYTISDPPSDDVITYLRRIAERMNCSGRIGECVKIYESVRKPYLQALLKRILFEQLSVGYNTKRFSWDELKVKMEMWTHVSKICILKLFDREKKICDQIFVDCSAAKNECFVGTVDCFAVTLFGFVEALSLSKQVYKRMEAVLSVYGTFFALLPVVDALFASEPGKGIQDSCHETLARIQSEVTRMLHDFELDLLHEDPCTSSDDCGGVDPTTGYVADQIELIARNKPLLDELIKCEPSLEFGKSVISREEMGDISGHSFVELHLILILVLLQKNLQMKANAYKNATLGQLFMMNNLHHVAQKVEASPTLQQMIGESHVNELNRKLEEAMSKYQALTCSKFLNCFEDKGLYVNWCCNVRPSRTTFRKRLINFNAAYEETLSLQRRWTIPASRLREKVRSAVRATLVPSYERFLEKFSGDPELVDILHKNNRYSAEAVEILVQEKLFADSEVV